MNARSDAARPGILAVWNDRDPDMDAFYEDWYVGQHLPERVGLLGWRFGRRYERVDGIDGEPQFFSWYELDSPAAAETPEYRARLNDPTPETVAVMQRWGNMTRTVCEVVSRSGRLSGAYVVVVRLFDPELIPALSTLAVSAAEQVGALGSQMWQSAQSVGASTTAESDVRGVPDGAVAAAILVECMRSTDAEMVRQNMLDELERGGLGEATATTYRFLCEYR